jgi:hypothetical protein
MTDDDEVLRKVCGTTLDATKRWNAHSTEQLTRDSEVATLMSDIYFAARVGWGGRGVQS